jgi:RecA/RadA recombinase
MSDRQSESQHDHRSTGADRRRRQLRALLLSAADTARQTRRIPEMASRMARPMGRAVRDRVAMLVSAAG